MNLRNPRVARKRRDEWNLFHRAHDIFDKLGKIDFDAMLAEPIGAIEYDGARVWLTEEMVDAIVKVIDGDSAAFVEIDDRPGRYGNGVYPDWFWALRRTRNSPKLGRKLFDSFRRGRA